MTMITENGTDQLSYSAAEAQEHHQNRDGVQAHRTGRWPAFPAAKCRSTPEVEPAGRLSASFSILSIAAPELKPAAFSPWISKAAEPL